MFLRHETQLTLLAPLLVQWKDRLSNRDVLLCWNVLLNACHGQALLIWVLVHWDHPVISYTSRCDWLVLFLTFAVNITQVGFESFFPRKLSATNRAFLFDSCRLFLHRVNSHHYLYHRQNMDARYHNPREENRSKETE